MRGLLVALGVATVGAVVVAVGRSKERARPKKSGGTSDLGSSSDVNPGASPPPPKGGNGFTPAPFAPSTPVLVPPRRSVDTGAGLVASAPSSSSSSSSSPSSSSSSSASSSTLARGSRSAGVIRPSRVFSPSPSPDALYYGSLSPIVRGYVDRVRFVAESYRDLLAAGGGITPTAMRDAIRSIASDRVPWAPHAPVDGDLATAPPEAFGPYVDALRRNAQEYVRQLSLLGDDLCALPLVSRILDQAHAASYEPCPDYRGVRS